MHSSTTSITNNIEELQSDILLESLENNSLFSSSNISMLNKALNTKKKNIVPAINEIKTMVESLDTTVSKSLLQQYEMIGDFKSNPELIDEVKKIDDNLTLALLKTNQQVVTVNKTIEKTKKDIVFIVPKVTPNICKPEIYFPYIGYLKRIVANISTTNTDVIRDIDIIVALEFLGEDNEWKTLYTITIPQDSNYGLKNIIDEDIFIDNKIVRTKVLQSKDGLTDLSLIATFEVNA